MPAPAGLRRRHATHVVPAQQSQADHATVTSVYELVPRFRVRHVSDALLSGCILLAASVLSFEAFYLRNEVATILVFAAACIARFGMTGRWPPVTRSGAAVLAAIGLVTNCWSWLPGFQDLSVHKLTIGVAFAVHLARSGFYLHALLPEGAPLPHWRALGADAVEMDAIGMPVFSWITVAMVVVVIFGRLRPEVHLENSMVFELMFVLSSLESEHVSAVLLLGWTLAAFASPTWAAHVFCSPRYFMPLILLPVVASSVHPELHRLASTASQIVIAVYPLVLHAWACATWLDAAPWLVGAIGAASYAAHRYLTDADNSLSWQVVAVCLVAVLFWPWL